MVKKRAKVVDDELTPMGKRRRSCSAADASQINQDEKESWPGVTSSRRRTLSEMNDCDDFIPRRSARRVCLETRREYEEMQQAQEPVVSSEDDERPFRFRRRWSSVVDGKTAKQGDGGNKANSRIDDSTQNDEEGSGEESDEEDEDEQEEEQGDADEEIEGQGVRRSGRRRHLVYNSLNVSEIGKELMKKELSAAGLVRRRPKTEIDVDDVEEEEIEERQHSRRNSHHLRRVETSEDEEDEEIYIELEPRRPGLRPRRIPLSSIPDVGVAPDGTEGQQPPQNEDVDEETGESSRPPRRRYFLRKVKPSVHRYEAASREEARGKRRRRDDRTDYHHSPVVRRYYRNTLSSRSPVKKRSGYRQAHNNSSTTSSSGSGSDNEQRFERRKARSMARARDRCLPMNFTADDLRTHTLARDRMRLGASLADIDPMGLDRAVKFDSVGGLQEQMDSLKEIVVFPLLYPEVFQKFGIQAPRGVLFHGPPGTGKTLVARALANECGQTVNGQQRVAFFMRKGADCLSKWVGESERQLRLLFDQAYSMRPSIIFFDEIDGLAPVRSTRQDQIHSSIVSTLLALMDGLDSRGEVIVIGATNRIDAIDPALRRPGRFDREFRFPLPDLEARYQILKIHSKSWQPALSDRFLRVLALRTPGFCGADLRAVCTEVVLCALRRTYPQIYSARDKLLLDVSKIRISQEDFVKALSKIVPTTTRSKSSPGRPLPSHLGPLLDSSLQQLLDIIGQLLPQSCGQTARAVACATPSSASPAMSGPLLSAMMSDQLMATSLYDENSPSSNSVCCSSVASSLTLVYQPRLLVCGSPGNGVCSHLVPAALHMFEQLPVHVLDMSALFSVRSHTPEEACADILQEAARTAPSILYLPSVHIWWSSLNSTCHAVLASQLTALSPSLPVLVLASADVLASNLPNNLIDLFDGTRSIAQSRIFDQFSRRPLNNSSESHCTCSQTPATGHVQVERGNGVAHIVCRPTEDERRAFIKPLFADWLGQPLPSVKSQAEPTPPTLPVAPPPEPRQLSVEEERRLIQDEEATLRELRIFLRECTNKLLAERKFKVFAKPVDPEEVPDYYEVISQPMDLGIIRDRIDSHAYTTADQWLSDVNLIASNCIEYNPPTDSIGKTLRHRAWSLKDMAASLLEIEMRPDFGERCKEIQDARAKRKERPSAAAQPQAEEQDAAAVVAGSGVRRSLRVRGKHPDPLITELPVSVTASTPVDEPLGQPSTNLSPNTQSSAEKSIQNSSRTPDTDGAVSSVTTSHTEGARRQLFGSGKDMSATSARQSDDILILPAAVDIASHGDSGIQCSPLQPEPLCSADEVASLLESCVEGSTGASVAQLELLHRQFSLVIRSHVQHRSQPSLLMKELLVVVESLKNRS